MLGSLSCRSQVMLASMLLLVMAFALYSGSFNHAWTYDDFPVVVDNPDIRSLDAFFADSYAGRPLRELTFLVDYSLFGLEPSGYHFQSIFWHGLSAFLLFLLARRLGASALVAWGGALLFVAHPVLVEVVANISHRKDSLALTFSLATILAYAAIFRTERFTSKTAWFIAALCLGFTAYSAKQNAIALLPMAFVYEWAFVPSHQRLLTRYRALNCLLLLAGLAYGVYWYWDGGRSSYLFSTQFVFSKMNYYGPFNEWVYSLMLLKSWVFMFAKVLLPVDLAVEYTYAVPKTLFDPWVLSGLAMLIGYVLALSLSWRKNRMVFFWLAWIGAFWGPVSNIWPLTYFAADRYLYAPMAGVVVLFCLLLGVLARYSKPLGMATFVACLLALSVMTWQQDNIWRDEFTLWSHAVNVSPDSVYALNNLGALYGNRGHFDKALALVSRAAQNPYYMEAQLNMARLYQRLGQKQKAAYYFQRARNPHSQSAQ